jgi:hypothetical protein
VDTRYQRNDFSIEKYIRPTVTPGRYGAKGIQTRTRRCDGSGRDLWMGDRDLASVAGMGFSDFD